VGSGTAGFPGRDLAQHARAHDANDFARGLDRWDFREEKTAARERIGEPRDPLKKLARGKFGERYRGDVLGLDAVGKQYRDPARHQRGLPGARPRLDQQRAVDCGQRAARRAADRERPGS
jgi:hypothetical protein